MSTSGWWHVTLGGLVCGIWLAAACGQPTTDPTQIKRDEIIDDDEYDVLPTQPLTTATPAPSEDDTGDDDASPGDDDASPGDDDASPGDDDAAGDDDSPPGGDDTGSGDDDASVQPPPPSPTPPPGPSPTPLSNPCEVQGEILTSVTVPDTTPPMRVAFYQGATLDSQGHPTDLNNPYYQIYIPSPFSFPTTFPADLPRGSEFAVEAWIDVNGNTVHDTGDLQGFSPVFSTDSCPVSVSVTLENYPAG